MKACVLGASLDVGNRGVRALGVSVAQLLAGESPGIALFFHYGNHSGGTRVISKECSGVSVTVCNCRLSPRSRPSENILVILGLALLHRLGMRAPARRNAWLRALIDADVVGEIRGGDSFSDIYGFRKFLIGSLPLVSVILLQRPYIMLPQTYGPFRWRASRMLARSMLSRASKLLTRDINCRSLVLELCGRMPEFCPDVAFTLKAVQPLGLELLPDGLDLESGECVVGINISGLLYMGGYTGRNMFGLQSDYRKTMNSVVEAILMRTSAKILLVPHVFAPQEGAEVLASENEEEVCSSVWTSYHARYPGRVFAVAQPLSECEVKWVIGRASFFVAARMHAAIAALSQRVPTVGLAYSDKFLGVFESAGVGDAVIDLRQMRTSEVVRRTLQAFEEKAELRAQLDSTLPVVEDKIRGTFRALVEATS